MTQYTADHNLPITETTDPIAGSADNLRTRLNQIVEATDLALTVEGERVKEEANPYIGQLLAGDNLDSALGKGPGSESLYWVSSTSVSNLPPEPWTGFLEVLVSHNGRSYLQRFTNSDGSANWERRLLLNSSDVWTRGKWKRTDSVAGGAAASANAVLVDEWSSRMGGSFNVGKTTTISVRIDHGLANFNSKLRPILETHQIPYTIALGADTWGLAENAGVTASMVNSWVAGGLCSIASHGWGNHLDTSDADTIRGYIVDSKARLEADIPAAAPVDIFMPPGASGAGGYGGFIPSDTPAKYYGTFAGQMALSTYPICSGQFPGTSYRVQDGRPRVGQAYFNMDTFDAAGVMARVNTAVAAGKGIQLMVHPSFIDGPGYITTAALSSVFSQIAAARTAGTVATLSVAKQYLANSVNSTAGDVAAARSGAVADAKAYTDERDEAYRTVDRALWRTEDDAHQAAAEATAREYTNQRESAVRADFATSHLALDEDGTPYFKQGSMTVRVLQDTDGVLYFEAA